ncbi:MAG: HtaA domain-containing protein [Thermoleophilaceae bacterium]|nr:HtaA domain-containing protein [Thermoleophilaceae bacterium]
MSSPTSRARQISKRALLLSAITVSAFAALVGSASAAVTLDWSQTKIYETAAPANTNRTWLGYLARAGVPAMAFPDGTATPSNGLTGPTVSAASAAGLDSVYTWQYPASSGSLNAQTLAGTLGFNGTLTFASTNHGIDIAISDPTLVLNGDGTGQLSVDGNSGATPLTDVALFSLDLSQSTCTLNWDGTLTLGNIVPTLLTTEVFGASYPVGSGPTRTPNTFGTFAITGATCAPLTGPKGNDGATGVQGPQGAPGPQGPAGKDASTKSIVLKRSVFKTQKRIVAKVTKNKRFVGYAVVTGRKLKVTYITETLKGTYKLTSITGKPRTASVKLG